MTSGRSDDEIKEMYNYYGPNKIDLNLKSIIELFLY